MDPVNPELVGDWPLPPVVQSDHVPSESEQEQIANRIRTMELAQENLENEIEEVKRSLELRIAEARAKREMIESLKGSLSAIRRLPDELLGEVFVFCVRLGGTSPWVLTHVSQRFRRIAFNTRKLWTMITIPSKKLKKRPYTYKFYRHHCGDIQSLRYILSLSGKAPLDVIVEQSSDEVALTLVQERERWDILEFHNYHSDHSIMFRVTNLGMVRKLSFVQSWVPFQWLEVAKPVSLHIGPMNGLSLSETAWWERLEDLSLSGSFQANIILDFRQNFSTLLQKVSKRLTRLNLVNILFPGESTIQFPRLRELAVNDVDGWHHIGCKNLQKIKLLQVAAFPTKIDYPEVQELEVGHYNLDTILGQLDLPNLDTLTISGQWWYSSRDWRNIKRLRLRLDGSSYSNLAYQLRPLHHVEILEVYDTPLALPFLKKFEAGQKRSPIFAVLKQFLVDYRQIGTKVAKDKLTEAFQAIVQSRKSNHPLEKLTVDWPLRQGGGMTEFV
ncbi:hypothetical protein FRC20_010706 [Serendipita sp. 405]|nr:hypothetical protein FRC20_010706 [Serendipita sp. 405]